MGASQPYMYSAAQRNSSRFPETTFDPKAVTRASWEPQPKKPKPDGPLVSFNRHPEYVVELNTKLYTLLTSMTASKVRTWFSPIETPVMSP
jgi:hypothetical protein